MLISDNSRVRKNYFLNRCKKNLRRLQRQLAADQESAIYKEIMISHADDKKLFYKLVNRQRNHGQPTISELIIDDVHVSDSDRIRQCWASYFKNLDTPVEDSNFDCSYKANTELKWLLIQYIDRLENSSAEDITLRRVRKNVLFPTRCLG